MALLQQAFGGANSSESSPSTQANLTQKGPEHFSGPSGKVFGPNDTGSEHHEDGWFG